ncbi:MAG: helix-turn-helix domain-containing protein [Ilumatobacteraceae bacterium]
MSGETATRSITDWERKVLDAPGAPDRVEAIAAELLLAAGLTALREQAGLSQRELAKRMGVSQPRVAAIERSTNVTVDVLGQYVDAVGGTLEIIVRTGNRRVPVLTTEGRRSTRTRSRPSVARSRRPA